MKGFWCILLMIFIMAGFVANAQPFGPPLYIADPEKMVCRYYFAGNEKHFNPRPENYTVNIGYTTDFKNENQACEFFRCVHTSGSVKVDGNQKPLENDLCICPEATYWDEIFGCLKLKRQEPTTFLGLIWKWVRGIFT